MLRSTFLKVTAGAVAALAGGRLPKAEAAPLTLVDEGILELGVIRDYPLVANGGLCAPLTPYYDIPCFSPADRPIRDALPSFQVANPERQS